MLADPAAALGLPGLALRRLLIGGRALRPHLGRRSALQGGDVAVLELDRDHVDQVAHPANLANRAEGATGRATRTAKADRFARQIRIELTRRVERVA
jgi:hypothetical protein